MRLHFVPFAGSGLEAASVVITGANLPKVVVPAGESAYQATVTISSEMLGMPDGYAGIDVFAVIQHMHGIGRKQWLSVVDDVTGT